MIATDKFHIGTSSFSEPDWVGPFYPPGTRAADFLRYYAIKYATVEIDSTYYRIPSARTVDGWADKTPEGFLFAAKFPRSIVHGGKDARPDPAVILDFDTAYDQRDRFLEVMSRLGKRLGPLVLQFPYFSKAVFESPKPFMERLDRFLSDLPDGFSYAVEIRNRGWMTAGFADMLRAHRTALVLVDQAWMPHGDEIEKKFDPVTADFTYIRLLGDRKKIESITTSWDREVIDHGERLERWADLVIRMLARHIDTLVYANNHYAGYAPATVERLTAMIEQKSR